MTLAPTPAARAEGVMSADANAWALQTSARLPLVADFYVPSARAELNTAATSRASGSVFDPGFIVGTLLYVNGIRNYPGHAETLSTGPTESDASIATYQYEPLDLSFGGGTAKARSPSPRSSAGEAGVTSFRLGDTHVGALQVRSDTYAERGKVIAKAESLIKNLVVPSLGLRVEGILLSAEATANGLPNQAAAQTTVTIFELSVADQSASLGSDRDLRIAGAVLASSDEIETFNHQLASALAGSGGTFAIQPIESSVAADGRVASASSYGVYLDVANGAAEKGTGFHLGQVDALVSAQAPGSNDRSDPFRREPAGVSDIAGPGRSLVDSIEVVRRTPTNIAIAPERFSEAPVPLAVERAAEGAPSSGAGALTGDIGSLVLGFGILGLLVPTLGLVLFRQPRVRTPTALPGGQEEQL